MRLEQPGELAHQPLLIQQQIKREDDADEQIGEQAEDPGDHGQSGIDDIAHAKGDIAEQFLHQHRPVQIEVEQHLLKRRDAIQII